MSGHVGSADSAADLVQLAQAERVCALDHQRVRLRDVDPRLDDRRGDEHVRIAGEERHPLLQLALGHLPVGDEEAQLRGHGQLGGGLLDRLDTVVQVEGLPAARVLTLERREPAPRRTRRRSCESGDDPAGAFR